MVRKNRVSGKTINEIIKDYSTEMKQRALNESSEFFVILTIAKKPKFKVYGKIRWNPPFYCIMVDTNRSNLPLPANVYNPYFKMRRTDMKEPFNNELQKYVGITSVDEYFTLPDFSNRINSDEQVGEFYATSAFTEVFDSSKQADFFISNLLDELRKFLNELANFIKDDQRKELTEWEGTYLAGVTKAWVDHEQILVYPLVSSFMEKVGGLKRLLDEDGNELKGA